MDVGSPFRIMAICTGNVCRSPLVERLLQSGLDTLSPGGFEIRSAGTHALVGQDMTPQIGHFLRDLGGDNGNFVARQVTPDELQGQNLVLALTRQHRSRVLELAPRLLRRTFTLIEFSRMVDSVSRDYSLKTERSPNVYDRWEGLLPLAAAARYKTLDSLAEDEVVDPYRREDAVYERMLEQVSPAVQSLINFERRAAVA